MDQHAVVWSCRGKAPQKLGNLVFTGSECRYSPDPALPADHPGLSCLLPAVGNRRSWVHPSSELQALHPPFQELIPPPAEHNLQRRLALRQLADTGLAPAPGIPTDWALLVHCGHGGIGDLDVFATDTAARDWYTRPQSTDILHPGLPPYRSLKAFVLAGDPSLGQQLPLSTASVAGMIDKLLVSIPAAGWDGRIGPPELHQHGTEAWTDAVLKFEPTRYPGLVALEALCLDLHAAAGEAVPRHWQVDIDGLPALAIERFDVHAHGRHRLESAWRLLAMAGGARHPAAGNLEAVGKLLRLRRGPVRVVDDIPTAQRSLYRRLCLALLTGNGDLHLQNLSILDDGERRLSPVYDPAPMRAWPQHDLLLAVPFGGMSTGRAAVYHDIGERLLAFGQGLGLTRPQARQELTSALDLTADLPARIGQLQLPERTARYLQDAIAPVRQWLEKELEKAP